jgi:hypothetical protein
MDKNGIILEVLNNKKEIDMQSFFQNLKENLLLKKEKNAVLLDLEDFFISNSFKRNLIDFLDNNFDKLQSIAVCGVGKGVRKVILQSIDFPIYIADDREDAFDWLMSLSE